MVSGSEVAGTRLPASPGVGGDRTSHDIRARWLVRVRWGSVTAQVLLVAGSALARIELPFIPLLGLVALAAATNVWLWWRTSFGTHVPTAWCGAALVFDTLEITAVLFLTGGPSNPFSVFYLVLITVAAVTLSSRWTWLVAVLAVSCYAGLFLTHDPVASAVHDHDGSHFAQHLRAMWAALTLAACLTTYFVTRLSAVIEQREREIQQIRERAARHDRVAALTTLAAGAAHELGTPLATAMVAAGELERALARRPSAGPAAIEDDVRLIRRELDSCRRILDGMAAQAGDTVGERLESLEAVQVVSDAIATLGTDERNRIDIISDGPSPTIVAPRRALGGALVNLLRNGVQAGGPASRIVVHVTADESMGRVSVRDSGCGMPPDVLARAGDPFYSTRAPGEGRGLGLFLARSLAERLGGRLVLESAVGVGTTARLELPLAPQPGGPS